MSSSASGDGELYQLDADEELRIEVECAKRDDVVSVELKEGMAEIFGTEMLQATVYKFQTGAKFSIFTYQGCQVLVRGKMEIQPYTSKETPMIMYLNVHAALEQMRQAAEERWSADAAASSTTSPDAESGGGGVGGDPSASKRGPIAMVVGPADVGKSTLCRILLNYAVRLGRRPIYADLDVGQGSISVPGSIGSVLVERPASIEDGFSQNAPLVYHYGHKTPGHNTLLYNRLVSRLGDAIRERLRANRKACASGAVVNTCGWVRGEGYNQLKHVAQALEADVILVLDQERVYNDLVRDMPGFVRTVWLPKSGGVVARTADQRIESRVQRVRAYFYGANPVVRPPLFPHSLELRFADLRDRIFKIGAPALPDSCMPIGMKVEENQTKLVAVQPSNVKELLNRLLAVSFADSEKELIDTNVAGYVCVTDVNVSEEKITLLSPQPKPFPKAFLLVSEIQYVDG